MRRLQTESDVCTKLTTLFENISFFLTELLNVQEVNGL